MNIRSHSPGVFAGWQEILLSQRIWEVAQRSFTMDTLSSDGERVLTEIRRVNFHLVGSQTALLRQRDGDCERLLTGGAGSTPDANRRAILQILRHQHLGERSNLVDLAPEKRLADGKRIDE